MEQRQHHRRSTPSIPMVKLYTRTHEQTNSGTSDKRPNEPTNQPTQTGALASFAFVWLLLFGCTTAVRLVVVLCGGWWLVRCRPSLSNVFDPAGLLSTNLCMIWNKTGTSKYSNIRTSIREQTVRSLNRKIIKITLFCITFCTHYSPACGGVFISAYCVSLVFGIIFRPIRWYLTHR